MQTTFFAVASIAFALACNPVDAALESSQRKLIVGGTVVSTKAKAKTYTVGLRGTSNGTNFCGGSLVSPIHVLTTSSCTQNDIRWASIGSLYLDGTKDGEQIKVVSVMNHANYSVNMASSNDFALLELDTPSTFKPVKLAAADDSDFEAGVPSTALGWGSTTEGGTASKKLRSVELPLISDKECKQVAAIDETMVCAGGVISKDVCAGDYGGPLVIKSGGKDVLIGVVSWNKDGSCGAGPYFPSVYSRVSSARSWIDPIIGGSCFD
ncbi:Serine protease trypsin-like protein [Phytophthora megakarya]|uniref:Serine protease trypsin-like protein n=1 Tax=Phytophthora megakarya TaxID=4795 RepID=A0A225VRC1_9STRA|nr:Serine protease trypsin-like protein [Phytophthora megakarya]